ncbi:hypothetical protein AOLI_G00000450 [Acnodon oligacanthus]
MERGTPQRKTVYRISLTLVKKESLQGVGGVATASRRLENPKVSAYRREGSSEIQRSCLLEEVKEVEDETDDFAPHAYRNFRTFSTGQLELGRLKVSRKMRHLQKENSLELDEMRSSASPAHAHCKEGTENCGALRKADAPAPDTEADRLKAGGVRRSRSAGARVEDLASEEERDSQKGGKLPKDSSLSSLLAKLNGKAAKQTPQTPPVKRHPSLLRRSFSFRHWTGSELLRIRALSKEKHHSSSGCIGREEARVKPQSAVVLQNPAFDEAEPAEKGEKRNTLDVGEVLGSRRERAKGKNRTLDNSDLFRLSDKSLAEKEGFIRGSGSRSSGQERRLIRFFSGIFTKKDGTSTPVSSPSNRALRKNGLLGSQRRATLGYSQSSTESVNGFLQDGNYMPPCLSAC